MQASDVDVTHRWTNDAARRMYEAYADQLRAAVSKRAADLGIGVDDREDVAASALLKESRRSQMSDQYRSEVWSAWSEVIDQLVRKMGDLHSEYTVPVITVKK